MENSFAVNVERNFEVDNSQTQKRNLLQQYERVIVESIVTSFGLDMLLSHDQYGGDVDTVHNVRQIGKDEQMTYKDSQNEADYANRGEYNSATYHGHEKYKEKNREYSEAKKAGKLEDAYTGNKIERNESYDTDHIMSGKEIHDDRGRVLAGLPGEELANEDTNLAPTNPSVNRGKKEKSMDEYLAQLKRDETERKARIKELKAKNGNLTDKEKKELNKLEKQDSVDFAKMQAKDKNSRSAYNRKIDIAYYTSPKFLKATAYAAGSVGVAMGARQALGVVFMEIWNSVKSELAGVVSGSEAKEFFYAVGRGMRKGLKQALCKYKELLARFKEGVTAGVLSSLTTTLINTFFTTGKTIIKIIRESWAALVKAVKILFWNPDKLPLGEQMKAAVKILAVAASVSVGSLASDAVSKWAMIPVLGSVVSTFCGTFVTGILSCTFLYILDHSDIVQNLVRWLNEKDFACTAINYYRAQAEQFERYAAQLMEIDWDTFKKEIAVYDSIAQRLNEAQDEESMNNVLYEAYRELGIKRPWQGDFDSFMGNQNNHLVFE